jgi:hypothetical protein
MNDFHALEMLRLNTIEGNFQNMTYLCRDKLTGKEYVEFCPIFHDESLFDVFISVCKKHNLIIGGIVSRDSNPPDISTCIRVPNQDFIKEILWPEYNDMVKQLPHKEKLDDKN